MAHRPASLMRLGRWQLPHEASEVEHATPEWQAAMEALILCRDMEPSGPRPVIRVPDRAYHDGQGAGVRRFL
jgi:hypothetical protein